nr:MAG TPA: hypothetical protein [Caudoviricetes sp.]
MKTKIINLYSRRKVIVKNIKMKHLQTKIY